MKCSYCNNDYPSKYYFIYSDSSDPCNNCFESKDQSCNFFLKGLKNLSNINSSEFWLKKLEDKQIVHDKSLLRFIRICIKYIQPLNQSPMIIEKFNVSISDWFIFFKFNFEYMWVPFIIIIAFFTITINIEVVLSILLTILLVFTIIFFRDVFLTGKECNLNLNFGYLEIKMPKMISFYLNKLPRSMRNYRDQKIFFKDIEEVMLLQKSNRFRGEYTQISIKLKSDNEIVLGNILNHEFAVEIKNIINKIFKNEIDLKNGLLKCP